MCWRASWPGSRRCRRPGSPDDVAAYLLAGADVVMTTSALLRHGADHVAVLLGGLTAWMESKGFGSTGEFRGLLASAASTSQ